MSGHTAQITNNGYQFGQGGYASFGRVQLVPTGRSRSNAVSEVTTQVSHAVNFRKGIVFYFGNLSMAGSPLGFGDVLGGAKDVTGAVSKTRSFFGSSKPEPAPDPNQSTLVNELKLATMSALQDTLSSTPSALRDVAESAFGFIKSSIEEVMKLLVSEVVKIGIPVLSAIGKFGGAMYKGIKATILWVRTQSIYEVLRKGEPTQIVKAIHKKLGLEAVSSFGEAVYEAAKGVAAGLTLGASVAVTAVIDAIHTALKTIYGLYSKVKDYYALQQFSRECHEMFTSNDGRLFDQRRFSSWLGLWMDELPIIASHCLTSKLTGSYMGFMSSMSLDESQESTDKLQRGYHDLASLQKLALDYVKKYPHKFETRDPLVQLSLTTVQSGSIDLTNGAAAESVGFFRRMWNKVTG